MGSDQPQDLTCAYKCKQTTHATNGQEANKNLGVSLKIDTVPVMGKSICLTVTITNKANVRRLLTEHVDAQVKEYNGSPLETFWGATERLQVEPHRVVTVSYKIPPSAYEPVLIGEGLLNVAVVLKDENTKKRIIATEEFNLKFPHISIEVQGGDVLQLRKEHTALVSFTNPFSLALSGAVLTVEASGLLEGKQQSKIFLLQPGQTMKKTMSLKSSSPGTKLLHASLAHNNSPAIFRSHHMVFVSAT